MSVFTGEDFKNVPVFTNEQVVNRSFEVLEFLAFKLSNDIFAMVWIKTVSAIGDTKKNSLQ